MTKNGGTISIAVEMLIKAVALAARFAGRMRERYLENNPPRSRFWDFLKPDTPLNA